MGVPSDDQMNTDGEDGHIRYIRAKDRFYFIATNDAFSYHTDIEKQEIVFRLISYWLDGRTPPDVVNITN